MAPDPERRFFGQNVLGPNFLRAGALGISHALIQPFTFRMALPRPFRRPFRCHAPIENALSSYTDGA